MSGRTRPAERVRSRRWRDRRMERTSEGGSGGQTSRLGIDVACRADHQASCADATGEFLWSGWRFRTTTSDLERLWAKVPGDAEVEVILEPTRNAWVPLAAWLQARGAKVVMVPPEQS